MDKKTNITNTSERRQQQRKDTKYRSESTRNYWQTIQSHWQLIKNSCV